MGNRLHFLPLSYGHGIPCPCFVVWSWGKRINHRGHEGNFTQRTERCKGKSFFASTGFVVKIV